MPPPGGVRVVPADNLNPRVHGVRGGVLQHHSVPVVPLLQLLLQVP